MATETVFKHMFDESWIASKGFDNKLCNTVYLLPQGYRLVIYKDFTTTIVYLVKPDLKNQTSSAIEAHSSVVLTHENITVIQEFMAGLVDEC